MMQDQSYARHEAGRCWTGVWGSFLNGMRDGYDEDDKGPDVRGSAGKCWTVG